MTATDLFAPLAALDWTDLTKVIVNATNVLDRLAADRELLGELAARMIEDAELARLCEHYDVLEKLVLHDDPAGWRLRLHVFLDGFFDRPHNHRWTYTSRILTGCYTHTLYGNDHDFTNAVDVNALVPRLVRVEKPGDTYTLHHSMIHSVTAHCETVTLIVRGPAIRDRFVVTDRVTGKAWWQYGAASESAEVAASKRMSSDRIAERVSSLKAAGLFSIE